MVQKGVEMVRGDEVLEDRTMRDARLERAIERALAQQQAVAVPAEFAARVAAKLPAAMPAGRPAGVSRRVGVVSAGVLLVAAFALAPHAVPSLESVAFDVELIVVAELAAVMAWLTWRWERLQ